MNQIDKKFIIFHQNNPHIYQEILKYTDELWKSGVRSFGIGAVFERIRWDHAIRTHGQPFKMNNNFRSRYVKLIERDYPQARGFFRCRELNPTSIFAIDYQHNPQRHLWP